MKAQCNYGVAPAANDQPGDTGEHLELAVDLDPHLAAKHEFLKAIELDPWFNDAMRNLASCQNHNFATKTLSNGSAKLCESIPMAAFAVPVADGASGSTAATGRVTAGQS